MELIDFLKQTQAEVQVQIAEKMVHATNSYPYPETVFAEIVMEHMASIGMTFEEPVICHFERTVGNAKLRLTGYAVSEEGDQLDLFVSIYAGSEEIISINDSETKQAADRCL